MKSPKPDKNKELMLACGSTKGAYIPQSPDDPLYRFKHAKDQDEKAMAWVVLNTLGYHHESPFCVDENGNILYLEHMAVACEWKLQTAKDVGSRLQSQGRIRLEGKRIWYCASIPKAHDNGTQADKEPDKPKGRTESEVLYCVQNIWGRYVADFIRNMPTKEKRTFALKQLDACMKWKKEVEAEAMAAARSITGPIDDIILQQIGIEKKRNGKHEGDQKAKVWVKMELLGQPEFVQRAEPDFVQTPEPTVYRAETDAVQSVSAAASLLFKKEEEKGSQSVSQREREQAPAATDRPTDPAGQVQALLIEEYGERFPSENPGDELCKVVVRNLKGAPLNMLRDLIRVRMSKATGMGFARSLSLEVGKRWLAGESKRKEAEAKSASDLEAKRKAWEAMANDPNETEEAREDAIRFLKAATG